MCWERDDCETTVLSKIGTLANVVAEMENKQRRTRAARAVEKFRKEFLERLMQMRKPRGNG